jgi:hypothetical protein
MNDSELEDQLRSFAPARPSTDLARRIERQLAASSSPVPASGLIARSPRPARAMLALRWLRDLGWAGAGAAIALAGAAVFSTVGKTATQRSIASARSPEPTPAVATSPQVIETTSKPETTTTDGPAFEPTETSRELVSVKNSDELLETENGTVREVRYTYLEHIAWSHPVTGARLEIEVPREDVYFLPVSLQ